MMPIDLRSDTVTRPSAEMLEAMQTAVVGDDVFGEDPSVNALEHQAAQIFGKEAGLFCPSGTMANQIGIKIHTNAPGEIICDQRSHVYLYEVGGIGFHSGLSVSLTNCSRGLVTASAIRDKINPPTDLHKAPTQLVVLENTCNKGGGSCYDLQEIAAIQHLCTQHQLKLHLDGARVFNALIAKGYNAIDLGQYFDSISICLSKGLAAPVGSVLLGTKQDILRARRIRKLMGGGMRQAGVLAAAGSYALDHHIQQLTEDHRRAKQLGSALEGLSFVKSVYPIETNIVIFELTPDWTTTNFLTKLEEKGIKAVAFGTQLIRLVTHLDFNDQQMSYCIEKFLKI